MRLETCTVSLPPPPTLGAMLATFGQLTEFRVAFGHADLWRQEEEEDEREEAKRARGGQGGTKTGS